MTPQVGLLLSCIAFLATHFVLSHPLRAPLVRAMGEGAFRGLYSIIALLTFGAMIYFYHAIGREPVVWPTGKGGTIAATVLMWIGAILFVGSFVRNPAMVGSKGPSGGPVGVFRLTRHPMMWGFALWAVSHLLVIGTAKAMVFDLTVLVMALGGAAGQDWKKARLLGDNWHDWTAQTAFVPFTRGLGNPGALALVGGTLLFLAASWLHPYPVGLWAWL